MESGAECEENGRTSQKKGARVQERFLAGRVGLSSVPSCDDINQKVILSGNVLSENSSARSSTMATRFEWVARFVGAHALHADFARDVRPREVLQAPL